MRRGAGGGTSQDDERSVFADGDESRRIARVEREGGDASDVAFEDECASTVGDVEDAHLVAGGDGDARGVGGDGDGVRGGAAGRVVEDGGRARGVRVYGSPMRVSRASSTFQRSTASLDAVTSHGRGPKRAAVTGRRWEGWTSATENVGVPS